MAKDRNTPAAPDLSNDMLSLVAKRQTAEPTAPPAAPAPAETPAPAPTPEPVAQVASAQAEEQSAEQPADNQQQKGKKEPALAPGSIDYASYFLKQVRGRKPKAIYVTEDMHAALLNITQATPDGVGLSDLLINIINHHFETFGPGIRQFLTAQEKLRKTKLPY